MKPRPHLKRPPPLNPVRKRRRRYAPSDGGGNILGDLLTLPVLGAPRMIHWMAKKLTEEAEQEYLDEGRVRGELLELQQRYDAGEVEEEEYDRQEKTLLERLNAIREFKARQSVA
ncbi:MAG: gas vesicle protein GvpG [Dehalococcoidia bacterium]